MATEYTSKKLIKNYTSDIEPALNKHLHEQFDQIKDAFVSKLKHSIALAESETTSALVESLSAFERNEESGSWITDIEMSTASAPKLVTVLQNDSHYQKNESSGFTVSFGMAGKRFIRTLGEGRVKVHNAVRNLLKKDPVKWEYPPRTVPFRILVQAELLKLKSTFYEFEHFNNRYHARVFDEVYRWSVYHRSDEDEKTKYDNTLSEVLTELQKGYEASYSTFKEVLDTQLGEIGREIAEKIRIVGTIQLNANIFDEEIIEARKSGIQQRLDENNIRWKNCIAQLAARSTTLLYLVDFSKEIDSKGEETVESIEEQFARLEDGAHARLEKIVQKGVSQLSGKSKPSRTELQKICSEISDSVNVHVQKRLVNPVVTAIEELRLSKILDEYTEKVMSIPVNQPEKAVLLEHVDLLPDQPKSDAMEVEWQKIIRRMLNDYVVNELRSEQVKPESSLTALVDYYKEIAQIVETNLDMVAEVTREEEQKPMEIASQGMERARDKVEETSGHIEQIRNELTEKILNQNTLLIGELKEFLNKDDLGGVKWVETQLRVRESAGGWKTKWTVFWANLVDRMDLFRRFLLRKYRSWSEKVMGFLGKGTEDSLSSEKISLATYLYETDEKFKSLPFIYRRLFDYHRDIDQSFYIRNPSHFDSAGKAHELWEEGFPSSLVIIGEKGSGKNTLNRFLSEEVLTTSSYRIEVENTLWKEEEIITMVGDGLGLTKSDGSAELIDKIKAKRKGSVIIIENIQNCFVRSMSGYGAVKALLSVIAETRGTVFWVVSSSRYAWNFLQVYLKIGEHFSHSVSTDKLSAAEIQSLIMKRQKASGYQLRFLPAGDTEKSRTYRKFLDDDVAQQDYLKELYFEKLTNMAEGNATVAIIYWVRSIMDFTDNEVSVQSLDMGGAELLGNMESNTLFALSSFLLHDALSPEELARSMHMTSSEAEMIISRLNTSGLLINKDGYYSLNQLIYRQVVRVLKNKNIVH